jgi:iron complex transport system permease protein
MKMGKLLILLALSTALALFTGPAALSKNIFLLRLMRVLTGATAGAGLSCCGVAFQAILRNPLAEPYILGISSGAGLGAVLAALFFGAAAFLPLPAFLGAAATIFLVYSLSRTAGRISVHSLLLSGVMINIMFSSFILFLISTAKTPILHDSMWWLLGNLQLFDKGLLMIAAAATVSGIAVFMAHSRELDAISIGEEEAIHLGIDTERIKKLIFISASVITAGLVSACGLIGFIGLIVPHMARALVGPSHRKLIPASAALGASLLVLSDTVAKIIMQPVEIPVGVVTALLGGPFFLILLKRSRQIRQK